MSLEKTLSGGSAEAHHISAEQKPASKLADLFEKHPIGSDFFHNDEMWTVEEGAEGERIARNFSTGRRGSLAGLFGIDEYEHEPQGPMTTEEQIDYVDNLEREVSERKLALAAEQVKAQESLQEAASAVVDLALNEELQQGKNSTEAVQAVVVSVKRAAKKVENELVGIPKQEQGSPDVVQEVTEKEIAKTESVGEVSPADRREVLDLVRRTSRELATIDGEIVRLKEKGAKDNDLSVLRQAAASIRRDLYKVVVTGAPEDYKRIMSSPRAKESAGDEKETQKLVLREFLSRYARNSMSQEKADKIFEQAGAEIRANDALLHPNGETLAALHKIDDAVVASVGAENISDTALVQEFKAEGVIPPVEEVTEAGELVPGPTPYHNNAVAERALSMQEEMDLLALGDHHEDWELQGSRPIHDHHETNFHPAVVPESAQAVSYAGVPQYKLKSMKLGGVDATNVGWSSFANRYNAKPEEKTVALGDPNNPDTWELVPIEKKDRHSEAHAIHHVAIAQQEASAEVVPVHAHTENSVVGNPEPERDALGRIEPSISGAEASPVKVESVGISKDVYERFKNDVGISAESLDRDPAFRALGKAGQLLVLRDVASFSIDHIKEETQRRLESEWANQKGVARASSKFWSFMTLGLGGNRGALHARRTQAKIASETRGGVGAAAEDRVRFMSEIARMRHENQNDVELRPDGSPRVNMISRERATTPEDRMVIERFNAAAENWSKISEFTLRAGRAQEYDTKSKNGFFTPLVNGLSQKEQMQYEAAQKEWQDAEGAMSNFLSKEKSNITDAKKRDVAVSKELLDVHERINMERYFDRHPNAEKQLLSMENPRVLSEMFSTFWRSAPKHMAYGVITRGAVVASLTALGLPAITALAPVIAAAAVSGAFAYGSEKKKAKSMLRARRESGVLSEAALSESTVVMIDNEANLNRKREERTKAIIENRHVDVIRLRKEVEEAEERVKTSGKKMFVERQLRELRDVKSFSDRINRLTDMLEEGKRKVKQPDGSIKEFDISDEEKSLIERKIAQTAELMSAYKNKGMLNYRRGYVGMSPAQGYTDYSEAVARAKVAVTLDESAVDAHVYDSLVEGRRNKIDVAAEQRLAKEIRNGVTKRVLFAVAGAELAGFLHAENAQTGAPHAVTAPAERLAGHSLKLSQALEWESMSEHGKKMMETGTGISHDQFEALAKEAHAAKAGAVGAAAEAGSAAPAASSTKEAVRDSYPGALKPDERPVLKPEGATSSSEASPHEKAMQWMHAGDSERLEIQKETALMPSELEAEARRPVLSPEGVSSSTPVTHEAHGAPVAIAQTEIATGETIKGMYTVARGDTLMNIMKRSGALSGLGENAREIAIADFIKFATPSQMREIGVVGDIHSLSAGSRIDMTKFDEALRGMKYNGEPLLQHATKLASGNGGGTASAVVESVPDSGAARNAAEQVASNPPLASGKEAALDKVLSAAAAAPEGSVVHVKEGVVETVALAKSRLSPEIIAQIKVDVDKTFAFAADKGHHLRGLEAGNIMHKPSPHSWVSVGLNNEYHAMQKWLQGVRMQTHIEPNPGEKVEAYVTRVHTTLHERALAHAHTSSEVVAQTAKVNESFSTARVYVDKNPNVFRAKSVADFLKEKPDNIRALGVSKEDYLKTQASLKMLTTETLPNPNETVVEYMNRVKISSHEVEASRQATSPQTLIKSTGAVSSMEPVRGSAVFTSTESLSAEEKSMVPDATKQMLYELIKLKDHEPSYFVNKSAAEFLGDEPKDAFVTNHGNYTYRNIKKHLLATTQNFPIENNETISHYIDRVQDKFILSN